jgi:hypothetical protein
MAEREINEEMTMSTCTLTASPEKRSSLRFWLSVLVAGIVALLLYGTANTKSADAKAVIHSYTSAPSTTQAGGHPDIVTTFEIGSRFTEIPIVPCTCNDPKDVVLHAPAGVIANPHVVSTCAVAEIALFQCSADAQAGVVVLKVFSFVVVPIYRMEPRKGQAGLFGFTLPLGLAVPQNIIFNARTGSDYGLDITTAGISHLLPPLYYAPIFWGVPGDPKHDILRFIPGERAIGCATNPIKEAAENNIPFFQSCEAEGGVKKPNPTSLPIAPLTQNPTTCAGPLSSSIDTLSYDRGVDHAESLWPETTGCDQLSFDPSLSANPTTTQTDTASGLEVDLRVPQFQDPGTPSPSEIRANTVTLPEGFSINPNAADGKTVCTDADSRIGTELEAECPEFSKVGTVTLDSSALPAPIDGYIYLAEPKPGNPYRLVLTANGFGTAVKLLGSVRADSRTGQLVTAFEDLPQAPLQRLQLHFFGSERGLLATPAQCGTYPVRATFSPWDTFISDQTSTQFFTLDSGPSGSACPGSVRSFNPDFEAGTADNTAGVHTPLDVRVTRPDGDQTLTGLTVTTPPGFTATLKGVPYCPQSALDRIATPGYSGRAEQALSACPAASQVGTAVAGAGAGTHPLYVGGKVYLAGPYKGAPLSLVVVVPAVSGPYDLGNVAVRAAIHVDPTTARVTAMSDPLPQILEGILIRTRFIRVSLDRPNFALNPTNCEPFSIDAQVRGDQGGASRHAPYQVANCADLPYRPRLTLRLSGGIQRRGHPAIHAEFKAEPGEANTKGVSVTLPKGELLDNSHIGSVCTRVDFSRDACPPSSDIGSAVVTTPLLDKPLKGSVYLRSSSHDLPDLVLDLEGQVNLELAGKVDSVRGSLRTTFEMVPDAPISSVVLDLAGGAKGLLQNSEDLCGAAKKAKARMTGQNGAVFNSKTKLQISCGSKGKAKRHKRHGRNRNADMKRAGR